MSGRAPRGRAWAAAALLALGTACAVREPAAEGSAPGASAPPPPVAAAPRAVDPPAAPGSASPHLTADPASGDLLLSWLEPLPAPAGGEAAGHRLRFARFTGGAAGGAGGGSWSEPRTVVEGSDFFANWADLPAVVPLGGGALAAHWLAKSGAGPYDYGVHLARSRDGGATWIPAGLLHPDDPGAGEHGFVSWAREGDGLRAFWLDGREAAKWAALVADGRHGEHDPHDPQQGGGAMTLRTARFGPDGAVADAVRLDGRVCDCCQTDAAVTALGPLVVYRDRSDGGEVRDIAARRRTAGGWSGPVPIGRDGWEIAGCPVNGPAVAADGSRVAVAWFTGAPPGARVRIAFSADGGATFGPPAEVDADAPLGRVDLALTPDGEAVVGWLGRDASEGRARLRLRRVAPDGRAGEPWTVAATGAARSSGFPRLARRGDGLVVVWVDDASPSRLRGVALPLAALPPPR